jgi:uncharacterized membrane protein
MVLTPNLIIIFLLVLLVVLIFLVYGKKGYRPILSLLATVAILTSIVIPLIIHGYDPVLVMGLAAIPITFLVIYLTEGLSMLSFVSIVLTLMNFFIISMLTYISIYISNLTGFDDEISSSISGTFNTNMPRLFIAIVMLGTLGVLIEMVVTQVGTVVELIKASPNADRKEIYRQSYKIGTIHLGSIINTLFLIYAGALFSVIVYFEGVPPLMSMFQIEPVSAEIIKILIGTIGLIVAMPTSTFFAVKWLKK